MADDDPMNDLASSVGDGAFVDWVREETRGGDMKPGAVRALRNVARIADFNRALQRPAREQGVDAADRASGAARWGAFTLLERVGTGTSGEVWRAWDRSLHREVAIKFLKGEGSEERVGTGTLTDEARSLARVRHPGVATVFGVAEHDGRTGMWMEFLRGPTLAAEIERIGPLPCREVARIGVQLCAALEALDQVGLVHRDIKPSNIILEAGGRAALADFGLGWRRRLLARESPRRGSGTPLFMAPALLRGGVPTPRTDLYALGVTLRWALTGRPPFRARTVDELLDEARRGPAVPLSSEVSDAPAGLVTGIERAMNVDVDDRYTAAEMRRLLADPGPTSKETSSATEGVQASSVTSSVVSIAVLPFVNRGADASDNWFADGLAEEMIAVLSRIRDFRVAARTSSFQFQGRNEDLASIGKALQVETLLEGSVRKAGDRVRVSVRLVQVSSGHLIWSERYDRTLGDLFALQDEIAGHVVEEVRSALRRRSASASSARDEVAVAVRGRGDDPEAHRLYLRARNAIHGRTTDGIRLAIDLLTEAVERDPTYALAWAELACAHADGAHFGFTSIEGGYARAREAVTRALELEPDLAEAHARLARILVVRDRDWLGAEASFLRALDRNPNNTTALVGAAVLLQGQGRSEEAITLLHRAAVQDPLNSGSHNNLGCALYESERWTEAEGPLRRALELQPARYGSHSFLAQVLVELGRGDEALSELEREPDPEFRLAATARVHHRLGNRALSDAALAELTATRANDCALMIAEVHGARGEVDAAFQWLERAYAQHDVGLAHIKPSLHFRSLRSDPRWAAFLKKAGIDF